MLRPICSGSLGQQCQQTCQRLNASGSAWGTPSKIEGPKQMLWAATLWEEAVPQVQVSEDLDDMHACSKELAEVPRLCRCHPNTAGHPVLDILFHCLKVRHVNVLVVAYADAAGHLARRHYVLWRVGREGWAAGGGREGGCWTWVCCLCGCCVCGKSRVCRCRLEYIPVVPAFLVSRNRHGLLRKYNLFLKKGQL
jgi:hypothetical protein